MLDKNEVQSSLILAAYLKHSWRQNRRDWKLKNQAGVLSNRSHQSQKLEQIRLSDPSGFHSIEPNSPEQGQGVDSSKTV